MFINITDLAEWQAERGPVKVYLEDFATLTRRATFLTCSLGGPELVDDVNSSQLGEAQ